MAQKATLHEMVNSDHCSSAKHKGIKIDERSIERIGRFFSWIFPSVRKRKCLFRSLLILYWSEGSGLSPLLNIGLKFGSRVQGHAWLTVNDSPFCDSSRLYKEYSRELVVKGKIRFWYGI